ESHIKSLCLSSEQGDVSREHRSDLVGVQATKVREGSRCDQCMGTAWPCVAGVEVLPCGRPLGRSQEECASSRGRRLRSSRTRDRQILPKPENPTANTGPRRLRFPATCERGVRRLSTSVLANGYTLYRYESCRLNSNPTG